MKKWILILATAAGIAVLAPEVPSREPAKDGSTFMKLKLKSAQDVLGAIAVNDFDLMENGAQALVLLSKKAEFQLMKTEEYQQHSDAFRRHAEEIRQAARNKNPDAAALGYVQMTLTCVKCHKYIRSVR